MSGKGRCLAFGAALALTMGVLAQERQHAAKSSESSQVISHYDVQYGEWTWIPTTTTNEDVAILAFRADPLKEAALEIYWFERGKEAWVAYEYDGDTLGEAVVAADKQFAVAEDLKRHPLVLDCATCPYDPATDVSEFLPVPNADVWAKMPELESGAPAQGASDEFVSNERCDDVVLGIKEETYDTLSLVLDIVFVAEAKEAKALGIIPVRVVTCGPWGPWSTPAWVAVSSTPAAGTLHCNYELQSTRTRTCVRVWYWCGFASTTTWTETQTTVTGSKTCEVAPPGPCPAAPPC